MRGPEGFSGTLALAVAGTLAFACSEEGQALPSRDAGPGTDGGLSRADAQPGGQDSTPLWGDAQPSPPDAGVVPWADAGPHPECVRQNDCASPALMSYQACTPAWSCIDGECVWECQGDRTCGENEAGCILCESSITCPGTPCLVDLAAATVEAAYCAKAFLAYVGQCFGEWVRLTDGTLCSLSPVATGAPRVVLNCGPCQTVLRF